MESNSKSLYTRAFFLFLLVSSNLLTYYLSSFSFCPFNIEDILHESSKNSTTQDGNSSDYETASTDPENLPLEFVLMTSPQKLPFGFSANFDSDTMHPPVGHPCMLFKEDLDHYMTYDINSTCPDDELLAQKLLLKGCEPLPRRRCHPVVSPDYAQPFPLPESLWATPSDTSVVWTAYSCKDYECLINRKNQKAFDDCKDCFDLNGREKTRWINGGGLDFSIDGVLGTRSPGTVRIGLDIGGGTGTFAVRMKERNITIITTSMNLNGPFNSFIASRGVIPLYLSISQRLPLFDNTLDIVHSMHVMSNWIPTKVLHFLLYDIYRVLRPGGVFWLDHFFCIEEQLEVYVPLIESIGFDKVKWLVGRKLDRGPELGEMYISALLEKPLKRLS